MTEDLTYFELLLAGACSASAAWELPERVTATSRNLQTEGEPTCPNCGSPKVEWQTFEYSTGVALDGYREEWVQTGLYCYHCKAFEEVDQ